MGAGWVGRQIGARFARYGFDVLIADRDEQTAQDAVNWIGNEIGGETSEERKSVPDSSESSLVQVLSLPCDENDQLLSSVDLAIESVPEQLSVKKRVLKELGEVLPRSSIIASNSSYFVPTLLEPYVATPERYAHMHFHVPVLRDSVVDIVGGTKTSEATISALVAVTQRIEMEPLLLHREHPGYVFNWMLQALLKSALELVALDVVDAEQVDHSWKHVTGMPLGPFGMMDQIGLDVIEQVLANSRYLDLGDTPTASVESLLELVREQTRNGRLGIKTHKGFYDYPDTTSDTDKLET